MSVQLLDKTRKINKLLHNSSSSKVVFNDICQVLMETLSSNILVLSKKGKVLGGGFLFRRLRRVVARICLPPQQKKAACAA